MDEWYGFDYSFAYVYDYSFAFDCDNGNRKGPHKQS